MTSDQIQKYNKYPTPKLKLKAQTVFNAFIRKRDEGLPCISCGSYNTAHASHFMSAGNYNYLRFNEDNVHLSCVKCNTFLHGNLIEYRKRLIQKIGQERVEYLELMGTIHRTTKNDRYFFIEIIEKYKN